MGKKGERREEIMDLETIQRKENEIRKISKH
jgi:hypothetical protein